MSEKILTEILWIIVDTIIFCACVTIMWNFSNLNQNVNDTFSTFIQNHNETTVVDGDCEYWDHWNSNTSHWEQTVTTVTTNEILDEISTAQIQNFAVGEQAIPVEVIQRYRDTNSTIEIMQYLQSKNYIRRCEYDSNNQCVAIRYT